MPILTLTTDLGTQDQYVAALKGSILTHSPSATIVDISHNIPNFDFYKAAYILKHSFYFFPEKTIHLIGVNPFSTEQYGYISALYRNHYFIASDSGVFSALFEEAPQQLVKLSGKENPKYKTFSVLDLPVKAAAKLLNGGKLSDIGEKITSYTERSFLTPYVSANSIDGYVVHIDKFDNVVTDISEELFTTTRKNRAFTIAFKKYNLSEISTHYEEVIQGENTALFNFQGYLEIAMNYGNAASLTNFGRGDKIKIIFEDDTNS
jgi:S-adenosylmethionine hydrolase